MTPAASVTDVDGCADAAAEATDAAPPVDPPRVQASCDAASRILTLPSRFEEALRSWAQHPEHTKDAVRALTEACDRAADEPSRGTDTAACTFVGLLYISADGVKRDPAKTIAYFERAAAKSFGFGARSALSDRAMARIDGGGSSDGVGFGCPGGCETYCSQATTAIAAAMEPPLRHLCSKGHGAACSFLSVLEGGLAIDYVGIVELAAGAPTPGAAQTSADLLALACKDGVAPACESSVYLLPDPDAPAGTALLERSCALGWATACLDVGKRLAPAHPQRAVAYWDKACALGLQGVCADLVAMRASGSFPAHP